jgi:Thioredoxin like C-terminal domain
MSEGRLPGFDGATGWLNSTPVTPAKLLLRSATGAPVPFRVYLDRAEPGSAHGVDTDETGRGSVVEPRLYQLIRQPGPIPDRTIEIVFDEPGVEAYVFTFG